MAKVKGAVSISIDVDRIEPQTFAEIPFSVRNDTPDVIIPDTFLIRHDAPGNVVILMEPAWKGLIRGTLDNPEARCQTEVYAAFLMPGEKLASGIVLKLLFAPDGEKEIAQRFVGRLTYQRVGLEEFKKGVVRRNLEVPKGDESSLQPVVFWPGGGISEKAFTKKWISVAPAYPPGPDFIHPWPEPRNIYWWVFSVALGMWAQKEEGLCLTVRKHKKFAGFPHEILPLNTDLTIFDYADACALAGLDEIADGFLAGESIGGNSPELDQLELEVEHYPGYGGRRFSVKIKDLLDALVKIGKSKDFSKVDYIGVDVRPGSPQRPLTPDLDWGDVWQGLGVRDLWADHECNPPPIPVEVIQGIRDEIDRDSVEYSNRIRALVKNALERIQEGASRADVWEETQDRIAMVLAELRCLDSVMRGFEYDSDRTYHAFVDVRYELSEAATALGIDADRVNWRKCDAQIDRVLGVLTKRDEIEEVPQEIKDGFSRDYEQLRQAFEELLDAGRGKIDAGRSPAAVWTETEDEMITLYNKLNRRYELEKHKWAKQYRGELESQIFEVAYTWE